MSHHTIFDEFVALYRDKQLKDCGNRLVKDGIVDNNLSTSSRKESCAKEHNAKESDRLAADKQIEGFPSDYSFWWKMHVHLQFSHRISEWAYGILNDFPDYASIQNDYDKKHTALQSIAFINVKKVAGGNRSDYSLMAQYIEVGRELLHQQITEINPTLIMGCFRYNWYLEHLFQPSVQNLTSDGFNFFLWNHIPVFTFHHPSSRKRKDILYGDLEKTLYDVKTSLNQRQ